MPLGKGIAEVVEAVQVRIEVSGHAPTWRVTGGSFESALEFAREAYDDPVVVSRTDSGRWWPRVTLTVTKDPALAATAPALESLQEPPAPKVELPPEPPARPPRYLPSLDQIFEDQEADRAARRRQRRPHRGARVPRQRQPRQRVPDHSEKSPEHST
ncbi:MAG: hypothetical protein ACXVXC_13405 [Nocardioidaceae bacterium]